MNVMVCSDVKLAAYNFGEQHPFGPNRFHAFYKAFQNQGLDQQVGSFESVIASQQQVEWFHEHKYVENVKLASLAGGGYLDRGDTPAFPGVYEATCRVVGTTLKALQLIMEEECKRAFVPIAGLHHARRHTAAGFCVFNDCAVVIEALRRLYNIKRVLYVDIDAHHGDGVFYSYENDPDVIIVDVHEDGQYLYPGTGAATESGLGNAKGSKLNVPLAMGADDATFEIKWPAIETFILKSSFDFIILQCGADSIKDDPITHLALTAETHAKVTQRLCQIADDKCLGRLLVTGGGGYNLDNIAEGWCAVVDALVRFTDGIRS
jgi:acetoin utilization protein AcuC